MVSPTQRLTGTIKWYNTKQGFGFVTPDKGGNDVFVHYSALPQKRKTSLNAGDRIAFHIEQSKKGPSATDVVPLDESAESVEVMPETKSDREVSEFSDLDLSPNLLRAVQNAGYSEPTSIQTQAIPHVLAGRDVMGCAQTGTGKTAAFALPILRNLSNTICSQQTGNKKKGKRKEHAQHPIRVLVLAPTRELAIQIGESFSIYGQYTKLTNTVIFGGVGQNPQVQALKQGVDVLIATPGRLLDLIGQGHIKLDQIEVLVLDEADRMLDMGFIHDMRRIIKLVPTERQTLLFSATMPREIIELAGKILRDPVEVSVAPEQPTVDAIDQAVYFVDKKEKQKLLEHILKDSEVTRVLIFTRTKHGANRVVKNLKQKHINAEPIHGNKSQTARQRALKNFRDGKTRVLVATDVVARGIDVEDISHVIQFDLPNEPETYIHRIGRTGRAGAVGSALSFCSDDERPYLNDIEKLIRNRVSIVHDHPYEV
ncbi:MAG: DEAD/DEAH box helicase [Anaerolineae bacterium]|nr:DEAD/DEAH box helicase [Anaerolineae bacterium]